MDSILNCCKPQEPQERKVFLGQNWKGVLETYSGHPVPTKFVSNEVKNTKYSLLTFIPKVLYEQFKVFINLYFLAIAISQLIPDLRVTAVWANLLPLMLVISITMCREAYDDLMRWRRDREVNKSLYKRLTPAGIVNVTSEKIKVGDLIYVEKDCRIPADMILLRTTEKSGSCFLSTDQLDGETDWKLRLAVGTTQKLSSDEEVLRCGSSIYAEKPQKAIYNFIGNFHSVLPTESEEPLNIENTLWANTVMATGTALGAVIYTGKETRSCMNTNDTPSKTGHTDTELNNMTKLLFLLSVVLSTSLLLLKGINKMWYQDFIRFIVIFSYIIPINLRVNLDLSKIWYSICIHHDDEIPGTVARNTTIPEELGRIRYLLSDKTGTLTKNEMIFKKLHLGTVSFDTETFPEVREHLLSEYKRGLKPGGKVRETLAFRVTESVRALAICHNVTPSGTEHCDTTGGEDVNEINPVFSESSLSHDKMQYQAASPDEIALVEWTEVVNLTLVHRDRQQMKLRTPDGRLEEFEILLTFPFTSESKRMGIIVREVVTGEISFVMKGADVVMINIVQYNDWLEEECSNMAREGLRTLVVAKKRLSQDQYDDFERRYNKAKLSVNDRAGQMRQVQLTLEGDMKLLCVTGVEDQLQPGVRTSLELLSNAGISVWMLTGDKLETATNIAVSSCLVQRTTPIFTFNPVETRMETHNELNNFRKQNGNALVIQGDSIMTCLEHYEQEFVNLAMISPAVVVCRCSPTQKAAIVHLIKKHSNKPVAAIGDGGNDVSMIQAADLGVGIVGKEGKQASLAADFSINQFSYIGRLLLWHGRNSYNRCASLSQYIFHRGLILSIIQAIFIALFHFVSIALYPGEMLLGYTAVFTAFPAFLIVLDVDVESKLAMMYPELYKELQKGRAMSPKTFLMWILVSVYQGSVIMFLGLLLFQEDFIHVVSITFTVLIITELLMVILTIETWHWLMAIAQVLSLAVYGGFIVFLPEYFDPNFLLSPDFLLKFIALTAASCLPLFIMKYLRTKFAPPIYAKLQQSE